MSISGRSLLPFYQYHPILLTARCARLARRAVPRHLAHVRPMHSRVALTSHHATAQGPSPRLRQTRHHALSSSASISTATSCAAASRAASASARDDSPMHSTSSSSGAAGLLLSFARTRESSHLIVLTSSSVPEFSRACGAQTFTVLRSVCA